MTEVLALSTLGMALLLCLFNWRLGMSITLLVGFLQDPLRKLVPGQPVYLSVMVGLFVAVVFLGALAKGAPMRLKLLHGGDNRLRYPLNLFFCWCLASCVFAYVNTGSTTVAGIGLIAYFSPLPAILLAIVYARNPAIVSGFLRRYLWVALLFMMSIYLVYLGYDWEILDSVGRGLWIYPESGGKFKLPSGLFRVPENAAWHGAAAACFLVVLANSRPGIGRKLLGGVLMLALVGAILLTGRRKALMEIIIFVSAYSFLLAWFRRGSIRLAATLLLMGVGIVTVMTYAGIFTDPPTEQVETFTERGLSVGSDAWHRLKQMTVDSFRWVIARNGILGSGAGTGSQGAQHFGAGSSVVGGAAEGGIGKVLAELGVPGVLMLLWLGIAILRHLWKILAQVASEDPRMASIACGLVAFLVANSVVFAAAHQIFGDVFVLLVLGWTLGFLLAIPRNLLAGKV